MNSGTVTANTTNAELVQNANQVYNQIFWGTLLREFRETSEETVLDGGRGGAIFAQQLDQEVIRRMSLRKEMTPLAKWLTEKGHSGVSGVSALRSMGSVSEVTPEVLHG